MRVITAASLVATLLAACGAARPAEPVAVVEPEVTSRAPASAIEFVEMLRAIATGAQPGSLEEHVDHSFAERLPSGDDLSTLFSGDPDGCTPELVEQPGYGAVAIPPPMDDDSEEAAARIESIIDELRASTEVMATCTVRETIDDEEVEREMPLYAIAVRRGEDGAFRALAWRAFRDEGYGH